MAPRKARVAIAYDFDGTLAPGNMQEHAFLPNIGIKSKDFWAEAKSIAQDNMGDEVLVYMSLMIEKSKASKKQISRKALNDKGKAISLFPGVIDWFDRVDAYAKERDVIAEHYLISSGNEEIAQGTVIAKKFRKIFASKFRYDENDDAVWPVLAVNYTNKTQFLFRINKGVLDEHDKLGVNKFVPKDERPIPFENMIFLGDGDTDVPCFRLVKDLGGLSLAVHEKGRKKDTLAKRLLSEGRVHAIFPADYSKGLELEAAVLAKIDEIAARFALSKKLA